MLGEVVCSRATFVDRLDYIFLWAGLLGYIVWFLLIV